MLLAAVWPRRTLLPPIWPQDSLAPRRVLITANIPFPALPAGEYKVTVEFSGFGKQTKNITLQVGQAAELGFTLSPGEMVQKVEVEATAELAEPTRTQVSTVITENQIVNLPVNGREFINFALLSPAVAHRGYHRGKHGRDR